MITISLCMIVKNEEEVLERCLQSVYSLVDEIIIVDTGSTDHTKELAEQYTAKIYDFPWIEDFSAARNTAFSKATMQYCMWLDADDVILPEDLKKMIQLKKSMAPDIDMIMMKYHTGFDEKGLPTFSYYRERIIRNDARFVWQGAIHEVITPAGNIVYSDAAVTHKKNRPGDPDRNLRIFERLISKGVVLDARQQFYYARELYEHQQYSKAVDTLEQFLELPIGWLENKIDACQILSACYEKLGKERLILPSLLKSLEFDTPRAELCCEIGRYFLERGRDQQAIFWYELATKIERNDESGAFVIPDCYDYIPYLQLCVCYDRLGDKTKAKEYNEKAGNCKPQSSIYLHNKAYFDQ